MDMHCALAAREDQGAIAAMSSDAPPDPATPPITVKMPHPVERALERYGIVITRQDLYDLDRKIATGRAMCLHKTEKSELTVVSLDTGPYRGQALVAVWDRKIQKIRTFLPPETATDMRLRRNFMRQEEASIPPVKHANGTRMKKVAKQIERRENRRGKQVRSYEFHDNSHEEG